MALFKKIAKLSKNNIQYILAAGILVLFFFIGKAFPAEIITSETCVNDNCKTVLEKPVLSDSEASYYVNDIFKSRPNEYYRLTFNGRSNQDSSISIKITAATDESREIKVLDIKKDPAHDFQEVLFSTDGEYTDLLFEKKEKNDGAEISIDNVQISKLNISSKDELKNLMPTIYGGVNLKVPDQKQTDSSHYFSQLMDPGLSLGQIFKPRSDFITGVSFDFDVIKQSNMGGKTYKLELREADFSGSVPEVSNYFIYNVNFSLSDLDNYRQADGKFWFPVLAHLDKNKYYFIGINNDKLDVNKYNYLRLKGSIESDSYADGTVAVRRNGKTYSVPGDLYFITYGASFNEYNGIKILSGSIIEDIGKNERVFKFQTRGSVYDLANLDSATPDINFDYDKQAITGSADPKQDSYYIYKFETIFPFSKINISARQADIDWNSLSLSYSFDGNNWKELPSSEDAAAGGVQVFNYDIIQKLQLQKEIYIKVAPGNPVEKDKSYGIKDFKIEADLINKGA